MKNSCLVSKHGFSLVVTPKKNRKSLWEYDEVEHYFLRLKRFRKVCTRYDKFNVVLLAMKLSITLNTLTARIMKLSSDSQSRIEPTPFYSWWDTTDRRADSYDLPWQDHLASGHSNQKSPKHTACRLLFRT